jgi:hypothetical protein
MTERFDIDQSAALPLGQAVPSEFLLISEPLYPWLDRKLGYFGDAPFVLFYYEPRGDGVAWNDGRCHGFEAGAWYAFVEQIAPLMDLYEVNLGSSVAEGPDVLLIDRVQGQAYFAEHKEAQRWVAQHQGQLPER